MASFIGSILMIAVFLLAGVWCLTQAKRMQKRAIAEGEKLRFNPFGGYIKSRAYVPVTRIIGVMSILIALFLTYVILRD